MDVDLAGKSEGKSNAIASHCRHPDDPQRVRGIADDNLFPFSSGNHEHLEDLLPSDRAFVHDPTVQ